MKTLLTLTVLILTTFCCVSNQTPKDIKSIELGIQAKVEKVFRQVSDFPIIKDTAQFITDLRQSFDLEVDESHYQKANEKITTYRKVKLYGSDKDYIFIEYDYKDGCMAAYPWKYQLLMTTEGKPIKSIAGQRFEFVRIFPKQNPFLLSVIATAKGNGGHEIYKITADTLENVFEGHYNYNIQTFDSHQDNKIYEPNELKLEVKDFNRDGFNDIVFEGNLVYILGKTKDGVWYDAETINGKTITYSIDNPFKKVPIKFVFLYDTKTGHFKAKENFNEKYKLND